MLQKSWFSDAVYCIVENNAGVMYILVISAFKKKKKILESQKGCRREPHK